MGPCITFSGIKVNIIDSYTLVYICYTRQVTRLHLSTLIQSLVHTRLYLSTFVCDSSTLVYTRLHWLTLVSDLSTFVYSRLHSSSDSSVFLEQIHFLHLATFFCTSLQANVHRLQNQSKILYQYIAKEFPKFGSQEFVSDVSEL